MCDEKRGGSHATYLHTARYTRECIVSLCVCAYVYVCLCVYAMCLPKQVVMRIYVVHPPTDKRKKKDKLLKVEKPPSIALSPLNMHGLGAGDVDMLYEALARNIVMLAQQVDTSSAMQVGLKLQVCILKNQLAAELATNNI